MLGKLIKHEFRATGRVMLPLLGAALVLSPVAGLVLRAFDRGGFGELVKVLGGTFVGLFITAVAAVCVTSVVIMVRRFNSNLLQDEGYLMFTLPVSTHALIWSKLIVSFAWFAAAAVFSALSVMIVTAVCNAGADFSGAIRVVNDVAQLVGGWNIAAYILEGILCLFLLSCSICLHFYAAMALGHSFADHKTFLSVCFYVLLSIVMSWLMFLALRLFGNDVLSNMTRAMLLWTDSLDSAREYALIPHIMLLGSGAYLLVSASLYYIPTVLPLKKHLNIS